MSLYRWILSHRHVESAIGDLARDLAIDKCAVNEYGGPLETYPELYTHIRDHEGDTSAGVRVLREAAISRGQRHRRGDWWIPCTECPPHTNGDLHCHFEGTRDPKVREHVYRSRRKKRS